MFYPRNGDRSWSNGVLSTDACLLPHAWSTWYFQTHYDQALVPASLTIPRPTAWSLEDSSAFLHEPLD